jgi:hypothetical protein
VQILILPSVFLCRRADVDYFFQGNAADFALDPLGMRAPGAYLDFPATWEQFVTQIPPEDRGDVVRGLAKIFALQSRNEAERPTRRRGISGYRWRFQTRKTLPGIRVSIWSPSR